MLKELGMDKFAISERRDRIDLEVPFGEHAMTAMCSSETMSKHDGRTLRAGSGIVQFSQVTDVATGGVAASDMRMV
jgi:hypothetical protein